MKDGCAGFFTDAELHAGRGIVQTELDRKPRPGVRPADWQELAPMSAQSYDEQQVEALRRGDLAGCFGSLFTRLPLKQPLRLPGGRMKLVHRVTKLEPRGGRYGLGLIRAEADIHPGDWFLTCHFVDDRVMPGTLMYECCLHTLRIFLMRLGWVGEVEDVVCEPVPGVASRLKCRGQVTETTQVAAYEVSIKELGYRPQPYALADAIMYADGKPIVEITDMALQMTGLSEEKVRALWRTGLPSSLAEEGLGVRGTALFNRSHILAFATGKPSEAFGEPYRVFDDGRFIARLPGPPYSFIDRITRAEPAPWKMTAGGVIDAEYDVPPDAWYFEANRQESMPFAVLLEVALQVCGFQAAYMGSALTSPQELRFRNLGGKGVQHHQVSRRSGTLRTTVKVTRVSASAGMIIQHYDFAVRSGEQLVYDGDTYFGFFSREALAQQVGIREASPYEPTPTERSQARAFAYPSDAPFPDRRLRMLDRIHLLLSEGGPQGLGFVQGSKDIDPAEWYFKAHFFQDPVWPGSLGLESFLQLLKAVAVERWGGRDADFSTIALGKPHRWLYRGQVLPENKKVTAQAVIKAIDDTERTIEADGYLLVDGLVIYQMSDFTLRMEASRQ
jgi:3-hydroxymyristoyl/3-hydroxydecanoyl-(acyl carrier protein) dehydratase